MPDVTDTAKPFWSVMRTISDLTASADPTTAWRLRVYRDQYMAECLAQADGRPYSPWAPGDHHLLDDDRFNSKHNNARHSA